MNMAVSPPSVFEPAKILPSEATLAPKLTQLGPRQRTHPDQVFFCIGPSSRMRMTPARPFPPHKRVNQSLTPYHSCADGARRRRVSLRPPPARRIRRAARSRPRRCKAPSSLPLRHGGSRPSRMSPIATLARHPTCKRGRHSQTRGPHDVQATSPGPGGLRNIPIRFPMGRTSCCLGILSLSRG